MLCYADTISIVLTNDVRLHVLSVGDEVVSSIGKGLCILLGMSKDDTQADVQYM